MAEDEIETEDILYKIEEEDYSMSIVYCEQWLSVRKKPHKVLTTEEAILKNNNQDPYVAVIYDNDILEQVISIYKDSCSVRFYDEDQMLFLVYQFTKIKEKLFLEAAYHYGYVKGKKVQHTFFRFDVDGNMYAEQMNYSTNEVVEKEGKVDVSTNWEEIPSFGDYSSIARIDR